MHLTPDPPGDHRPESILPESGEESAELDLTCPSCGADLIDNERFVSHRVCGSCGRHFAIGARERIALLVDTGVFQELETSVTVPEDTIAHDQLPTAERLAEHQHLQVIGEAVVTGFGSIGGVYTVIIALDDHLVGHILGALMSEKVMHAFEYAQSQKLPVVLLAASGTASVPAGPLSLAQGSRLAAALARLHLAGVPILGALAHPLSAGMFGSLAVHCDVLLSEPGVVLHEAAGATGMPGGARTAESLLADGWIDDIVDRDQLAGRIGHFADLVTTIGMVRPTSMPVGRDSRPGSNRQASNRKSATRRTGIHEYVRHLIPNAIDLRGDRISGDVAGVACGFGRLESMTVAFAALAADSGAGARPAVAARKIIRLVRLAGRFELPVLLFVDGHPGGRAAGFAPDAAFAEAQLASVLSLTPVPIITVGLGELSGPLPTMLMNGDRQYMLSSAVCAPTLEVTPGWQPGRPAGARGAAPVLTARDCERLGLIDGVIPESDFGEGNDQAGTVAALRGTLAQALAELNGTGQRRLLDTRLRRQRSLGQSTPEGLAEARSELWALQDWQRNVERSIDEWRGRWEHLKTSQTRISFQRPDIADLAARVRARRSELLERAGLGDRSAE
jgi:acetyl-CoA carboxylase carboxyl transferase subunit beta